MAGTRFGSTMRRNTVIRPAPSDAAASSISRSSSSSVGCTVRTTNGSVTNRSASTTAPRVKATLTPTGLRGPYSATSVSPATIVGSANGRSISAFTSPCPTKRSRTSTHASTVPMRALSAATTTAATSVSRSAASASGAETAAQKPCRPSRVERQTSAARGRRTTKPRYIVASPCATGARTRRGRGGAATAAALLPKPGLDLRHHSRLRIEEALLDLRPAAELLDREEPRPDRVVELPHHAPQHGPVAVLAEDRLAPRAVQERDERPRGRRSALRHRDRVLDPDRRLRDQVVDGLALAPGEDRLVLVGEHHVAAAGEGGLEGLARALVLRDDVVEELVQVRDRVLVGLALAAQRAVGGHDVPARATGGERVRRHDLDARLDEVAPVADVLRVAVPEHEDDHRARDHPVPAVLVPARADEARPHERPDVGLEREGDDVRVQAVHDRLRLVARRAVRLREAHALASLRLPEGVDQLAVRLLRRRVRDERDRPALRRGSGARQEQAGGDSHRCDHANSFHSR